MAHYAKILDGKVLDVIVAEPEFFDTFVDNSAGKWVQTSYNTKGGVHLDGGTPLRKNYATVGGVYDATRDAFIPPKQYESWTLNETTCQWEAPVAYPLAEGHYVWSEEYQEWVLRSGEL